MAHIPTLGKACNCFGCEQVVKDTRAKMPDIDKIIRYEQDEMGDDEIIGLFQELIDSGMAWKLQGHYGRTAWGLIRSGYCHPAGQEASS
jgi:hypothetical protein